MYFIWIAHGTFCIALIELGLGSITFGLKFLKNKNYPQHHSSVMLLGMSVALVSVKLSLYWSVIHVAPYLSVPSGVICNHKVDSPLRVV